MDSRGQVGLVNTTLKTEVEESRAVSEIDMLLEKHIVWSFDRKDL